MRVQFRKSFDRDITKIKNRKILLRVEEFILTIKKATDPNQILHLKKITGSGSYYRIRMGDFRIGVSIEKNVVTFIRILHRKEIYHYFP